MLYLYLVCDSACDAGAIVFFYWGSSIFFTTPIQSIVCNTPARNTSTNKHKMVLDDPIIDGIKKMICFLCGSIFFITFVYTLQVTALTTLAECKKELITQ
jgi:hypothetical protein